MSDMRTPLRRVRGLGAAGEGTGHFWFMRVSGVALLFLSLFAIGVVLRLAGKSYDEAQAVLAQPVVALGLLLFVIFSAEHMRQGILESIHDYIHGELLKVAVIMLNTLFCLLVGAASVFALLKIAFGG
ncbi:MAG TPA: succinate dehydrogenase, hydrophobic membrane anchor protein [Rhizobiaceae bacterium]|nr:succinate dehydrogenase, hydrophobic membrane anchor protein [Rhizobiaceae bacterium]